MDVIQMGPEIVFILDRMLPKTPLPDSRFPSFLTGSIAHFARSNLS